MLCRPTLSSPASGTRLRIRAWYDSVLCLLPTVIVAAWTASRHQLHIWNTSSHHAGGYTFVDSFSLRNLTNRRAWRRSVEEVASQKGTSRTQAALLQETEHSHEGVIEPLYFHFSMFMQMWTFVMQTMFASVIDLCMLVSLNKPFLGRLYARMESIFEIFRSAALCLAIF